MLVCVAAAWRWRSLSTFFPVTTLCCLPMIPLLAQPLWNPISGSVLWGNVLSPLRHSQHCPLLLNAQSDPYFLLGLCGNFNGDSKDDFKSSMEISEGIAALFVNTWRLGRCYKNAIDKHPDPCSLSQFKCKWQKQSLPSWWTLIWVDRWVGRISCGKGLFADQNNTLAFHSEEKIQLSGHFRFRLQISLLS